MALPLASYEIMSIVQTGTEDFDALFSKLFGGYIFMFAVLAGISSCVMLPGKLIIKNTVMRKGNQKLLNSLKESVIVAHRLTGNVIFANTATERLNSLFVEGLCKVGNFESFSTGMNEGSVFDREEK